MIVFLNTNIWETQAEAIILPVNCVGVAGKGLAYQAKIRYPGWFSAYQNEQMDIGVITSYMPKYTSLTITRRLLLINFPTKYDWRAPSSLEYIEKGLQGFLQWNEKKLEEYGEIWNHLEFSFPKLGCGERTGQLKWEEVKPLMAKYLEKFPNRVYIHE